MRMLMEPLKLLMQGHFLVNSERWELAETAKLLRAQGRGEKGKREYKATVVARMKLENAFFFPRLQVLSFDERLWALIPASRASVRFRALAFRLISRMGCGFEELFCEPARHCLMTKYELLVDSGCEAHMIDQKFVQ